jgi:hypothetical protein
MDIETAEQITGEKGKIEFLYAVGPAALGAVQREELLVALTVQGRGGQILKLGSDMEGVPRLVGQQRPGSRHERFRFRGLPIDD